MQPFDLDPPALASCHRCPRLASHRKKMASEKRRAFADVDYWGRPVPPFGAIDARIWLLGLAPGAHGSNRTGRVFTGDASGDFLFPALHRAGLASAPTATHRQDGLELVDLFITQSARCAPPGNKPTREELGNCAPWLDREIAAASLHARAPRVVLALGRIAHDTWLNSLKRAGHKFRKADYPFGHAMEHALPDGRWLVASYHVSRQNTNTGRLTRAMFDHVLQRVVTLADGPPPPARGACDSSGEGS